ncbi:hypothetical protein ASF23_03895 [Curtobacterium sp. Leaf261]|nr:hypothetical protein ASF23_03895 [Curtobacterium sp. Leaf261]
MASTNGSAAKSEWLDLSEKAAATQNIVGGDWEYVDSNADDCGDGGAHWGITRLGPGVPEAERNDLFDRVQTAWKAFGWDAARTKLGGDAPGLQLRYPASGVREDGFYIEFDSTVHGTTIGAQTSCAAGDVDQLAKEQFAYNNTPGRTPSATPTP